MSELYYRFRSFLVLLMARFLPRNTPIVFRGLDSSLQLCEQIGVMGIRKLLIVTDEFLHSSGVLTNILEALDSAGVRYMIFDGVRPDPTFDQIQEGEAVICRADCEAILAVGGGSVLDAAKMISVLHTNPMPLEKFQPVQRCKNPAVPLFAVPSTAGTGSEITPVAVITDVKTHKKNAVIDTKMIPIYIALDANIMRGMPAGVTAATGMDALTHAVESYLSRGSNADTEWQAEAATRLILRYLPKACENGDDLEARDAMALAAFYAGSAFSRTSVGYVHAIAHQLGSICGTPHGNANAMLLPEVLAAYGSCVHGRLAQLARRVQAVTDDGSDAEVAARFIAAISKLRSTLKLPILPRGLKKEHVAGIVKDAIDEAGELYPVPRYMSAREIEALVKGLLPASQPQTTELAGNG